ncbi:MAG: aminotransferase class V-fold PLP-dependent enzyme [Planctomycetota bacterium]|jgi:alanine-glyoxylate transaminase/serine-glyoxylate transaminase/serine-pyruvate transaminase|nr:aminotransferase class V-fold PLP-dependent enzyme [Planctomycetota bacterium]
MTAIPDRLLLGPGPCNVSAPVREAMAAPLLGHLDPDFLAIVEHVKASLRTLFGTSNAVTFPVSGTGSAGMEACLVNVIEPGDSVLVVVQGVFGLRLANLAERYGATVHRLEIPWGTALDAAALAAAAKQARPRLICAVNGETSTGVYQRFDGFAEVAREHNALLLADCVTSLAGMPVAIDDWGVDLVYSGTQKCLACPPGLAPVSFSQRALDRVAARRNPVPSFYLDVGEVMKYLDGSSGARAYHHTAPISMIYALDAALAEIEAEGLSARYARHAAAAQALIAGLGTLGLEPLVAEADRLHPLTTVKLPPGIDEAAIRSALLTQHGIEIGAGLGPLAGQVWRIGLMGGNACQHSVDTLIAALRPLL